MTPMSEVCKTENMKMEIGMTMIELLITIVVITILLALGVPSYQEFIKNNRVTAQTNDFVSAVQLARSEAVKRGVGAVLCASTDQATCDVTDGNWSSGWIVFSDLGLDGAPNTGTGACLPAEDCIIRTRAGLTKATMGGAGANRIRFGPTGMSVDDPSETPPVTFPVTFNMESYNCKHEQARDITITKMGHMTVTKKACP
jgi:type IV fimbrial biogenesis protein FimT